MNNKKYRITILVVGLLCIICTTLVLSNIVQLLIPKISKWKYKTFGEVSEIIMPVEIKTGVTVYRNNEPKDAVNIDVAGSEYTIIIPKNIDVSKNDYVNCKLTTYSIGSSFIIEAEYAETQHYYLMSNEMYYAGMNKGVALFTDNENGAVKFTQFHVNGEYGLFTYINMVTLAKQIENPIFVLCE